MDSAAQCCGQTLSGLSLSRFAQKAGDLPSWQIPLDVYVSPVFRTPWETNIDPICQCPAPDYSLSRQSAAFTDHL
jgi:hypothetical protein